MKNLVQTCKTITVKKVKDNNPNHGRRWHRDSADQEKAELLNSYFTKQSTIDDTAQALPPEPLIQHPNLSSIVIQPKDIIDAISLINPSKASGPDSTTPTRRLS